MQPSWPYRFTSPTATEIQQRRDLLNLRGFYAQCSTIILILTVRTYRTWSTGIEDDTRSKSQGNQYRKEKRKQYLFTFIWLLWLISLSVWNTGDGMYISYVQFQFIPAYKLLTYLLDYLHLTKAFGHVGISQLPFQVLMSPIFYPVSSSSSSSSSTNSKPSPSSVPSVLSLLTLIPQPVLTPYHRLAGRFVLAPLLLSHAALYSLFFLQNSHPQYGTLYAKRIRDLDVQCGVFGVFCVVFLGGILRRPRSRLRPSMRVGTGSSTTTPAADDTPATTATATADVAESSSNQRSWNSNNNNKIMSSKWVFYLLHVFLFFAFCLAIYSHVGYTRAYIIQAVGGFVLNVAWSCFSYFLLS